MGTNMSKTARKTTTSRQLSNTGKGDTIATKSQTAGAGHSSAAARTFAIPELLENILLNLDPNEILSTQRVDKTFYGFVHYPQEDSQDLRLEEAQGHSSK
ncbi:hypothetical protein CLAFUW4_10926 [Fulvia fulva]|uniref:F-box domain-containing protein n=1 Tax=Passalora fulva TaxID=5499 RepID=A0A9Q8PCF0_PASFU|nr:uncharacterized protein CLAFUR5_09968 [Fulvia fulva]KAK4619631.1 hypothetical protein CLAFUR4_10931 [Fulvia fulva]KAK4620597.1 hypothetical protein CLAFUR0_10938 [Fulvia fulva]UJO19909.1 hypothetical protein CLAFUR5_09968 [Fulvia fulva]WPV16919.1 hypothetical protein CLAFUW4_10926 [Fulvia fulva]WPV31961.1 hypothetical protein CLAFUW7_10924 [Fulvia fulva]